MTGGFNPLAAIRAALEADETGMAREDTANFSKFSGFSGPTPANRNSPVICICCRRPIPDPVRDWWGGDPVHRECGERDRREYREEEGLICTAFEYRESFPGALR